MNTFKILYIHGHGSSGNSSNTANTLRQLLKDEAMVISPDFPLLQPKEAVELAESIIEKEKIDLVIGSSLGGFIALKLEEIHRIVINPCMFPSIELPKRNTLSEKEIADFEELEKTYFAENREGYEEKIWCILPFDIYGVFSTNDELFSYLDVFKEHGDSSKIVTVEDNHRLSSENIEKAVIPLIYKIKNEFRIKKNFEDMKKFHEEDTLSEKLKNYTLQELEEVLMSKVDNVRDVNSLDFIFFSFAFRNEVCVGTIQEILYERRKRLDSHFEWTQENIERRGILCRKMKECYEKMRADWQEWDLLCREKGVNYRIAGDVNLYIAIKDEQTGSAVLPESGIIKVLNEAINKWAINEVYGSNMDEVSEMLLEEAEMLLTKNGFDHIINFTGNDWENGILRRHLSLQDILSINVCRYDLKIQNYYWNKLK